MSSRIDSFLVRRAPISRGQTLVGGASIIRGTQNIQRSKKKRSIFLIFPCKARGLKARSTRISITQMGDISRLHKLFRHQLCLIRSSRGCAGGTHGSYNDRCPLVMRTQKFRHGSLFRSSACTICIFPASRARFCQVLYARDALPILLLVGPAVWAL